MCYADYDTCEVWHEMAAVARKEHRCCKCGLRILAGQQYTGIAACFEGDWSKYRMHPDCWALSLYIQRDVCSQSTVFAETDWTLREELAEHIREAPELVPMYRRVLRARIREGVWPERRAQAAS